MRYRPIAYNLVCGILGAFHTTPRGIERIDFGYASHLFESWPADCVGILPTPWGMRFYPRDFILRARDLQATMWREDSDADHDPAFIRLTSRYADPAHIEPTTRRFRDPLNLAGYARALRLLAVNGIHIGKPVSALPQDTIYLDVGHDGLSRPFMLRWLDKRPDIAPVFMVHDAIPLEMPEIVTAGSVATHERILAATAQYARAVIVPTPAAGRAVELELARRGASAVPVHAVHLPIDDLFNSAVQSDGRFSAHPYFLVCGVIEARKNQALLVNVWRDLVARLGVRAPRLIIAGRPGHASGELIDQITRSTALREHVFLASGLSTPAMARLMAGARALLMPSFAEGFGLPPVEALTLGTPAVLSDIEAHRDAAGEFGIFLDPTDGPGWRAQIEAMTTDTPEYLTLKHKISSFKPQNWRAYMGEIEAVLREID